MTHLSLWWSYFLYFSIRLEPLEGGIGQEKTVASPLFLRLEKVIRLWCGFKPKGEALIHRAIKVSIAFPWACRLLRTFFKTTGTRVATLDLSRFKINRSRGGGRHLGWPEKWMFIDNREFFF